MAFAYASRAAEKGHAAASWAVLNQSVIKRTRVLSSIMNTVTATANSTKFEQQPNRRPSNQILSTPAFTLELVKEADAGDQVAQWQVGQCYYWGEGVQKNHAEAVRWTQRAAELDLAVAASFLGYCYQAGCGLARDGAASFKMFKRAAAGMDKHALKHPAVVAVGRELEIQIGAEQGHQPQSCYERGWQYACGVGVALDNVEMIRWWQTAADNNHALAQFQIAECYRLGLGVIQDMELAAQWFQKSAERGCPDGMLRLALAYIGGFGEFAAK